MGPYLVSKLVLGVPAHPLGGLPRDYWVADYWVTLFVSGVLTAATGALLVFWSRCLGCGAGRAALLGLAYGLATPAYVYATLSAGHQATAFRCSRHSSFCGRRASHRGRCGCWRPVFWRRTPL